MSWPESRRGLVLAVGLLCLLGAPACGDHPPPERPVRLVALGDSLTAGFGLRRDQAWPALVEIELRRRGWDVELINAGVSGDTTADGLARLAPLLRPTPDLVLIALGGNDGLQRRPIERTGSDLDAIVMQVQEAGADVALIGVRLPVFIQTGWSDHLGEALERVADRHDLPLLPDLLEDVLGDPRRMLGDGLHPNAEGQRVLAEHVADFVAAHHRLR